VLVAGGDDGSTANDSADLYDPATDTFSPTSPMAEGRVFHTATLLSNGRVLIAGGLTWSDAPIGTAEVYDPKTDTISPTGPVVVPGGLGTATLLSDGRVLIAGGTDGKLTSQHVYTAVATAELYA
jgi:hypothetical protein